jgi:DNA-binding transcriptional regulator YdaS (Cro superfamily)
VYLVCLSGVPSHACISNKDGIARHLDKALRVIRTFFFDTVRHADGVTMITKKYPFILFTSLLITRRNALNSRAVHSAFQGTKAMSTTKLRHDPVIDMVKNVRGTAPLIAKALGILPGGIWQWRRVPAQHVLAIGRLLKIPRYEIRPDLYPPPRRRLNSNGRKRQPPRGGEACR